MDEMPSLLVVAVMNTHREAVETRSLTKEVHRSLVSYGTAESGSGYTLYRWPNEEEKRLIALGVIPTRGKP